MMFLAFLAEQIIIHLVDWLIGGLAGWLIGRGGRGRGIGITLAIFYVGAVVGMLMGDGMQSYFGLSAAIMSFALMLWLGLRQRRQVS